MKHLKKYEISTKINKYKFKYQNYKVPKMQKYQKTKQKKVTTIKKIPKL